MADVNTVLKNAFIDSQLIGYSVLSHNFSDRFEADMQQFIKSQKGFMRLINTTAKRVACVLLAILFCLTTVACSIKEVREPILEEIEKFFVNAKELLTNTAADEVSNLFPSDVTKIVGTSYISKSKKQYVIERQEKVTDFIELLSETYWGEPEAFEKFDNDSTYWTFDFYNTEEKSVFQLKMCNDTFYSRSKVAIITDDKELHFHISNRTYREILAFTNRTFYLHDSKLERPDKEFLNAKKELALKSLDEQEIKEIRKKIRNIHYEAEIFLMNNVSLLKEKDSIYWDYVLSGKDFQDPISQYERQYTINNLLVSKLEYIISVTKDKDTKNHLRTALELWKKSVSEHDLEGLFKAHEYIHDYDYYVFNYPTHYVYDQDADYQGLDDYFGRIEE